ncbi:hypothetical protein [Streptomyces sp. NPDC059455]|uniref:hypothetical protein n=1 Tax=Streptomyces sp. NPDC059455 TaxID=3346837 RepID=UPI00368F4C48
MGPLRRITATLAAAASLGLLPLAAAPAHAGPAANHAGMTWVIRQDGPGGTVHVGSDAQTHAYVGDTPATASLPVLCVKVDGSPVPPGIVPDANAGWARGTVGATLPTPGTRLTSRLTADRLCEDVFYSGWRMAEFHDGRYGVDLGSVSGWSFWASENNAYKLPRGTRFWVAINDQLANPWN